MATKAPIRLVVVTPERQVVSEQTASVVFAAHDGELGVLHNRAPLDGGFAQVREDTVTILAHQAIPAEQVTPEMVGEAERKLEELRGTGPEAQEERSKAQQRASALRRILANE